MQNKVHTFYGVKMARIIFGIIAPIIITAIVWFLGNPPALSLLWDTADASVVGHETYEAETGFGAYPFHVPRVRIENRDQTVRLNLPGAPEMASVQADWPIGETLRVKINGNGSDTMAYAVKDPRRNYLAQFAVLAVGLLVFSLTLASYFIKLDTVSIGLGAFGLIFTILPLLIIGFRWQVGFPPPTAHVIWPTETVEIVSQEIESRRIGNGTIRHTPIIKVKLSNVSDPVQVDGYYGGFKSEAERVLARGGVGTTMKVNISPKGVPFEARWNIQQIATVIATAILPLFLFIGLVLLRVALPSRRQTS